MMPQKERRIILVEDDRSIGAMIVEIIEEETPHCPHLYTSGVDMLQHLKEIYRFQPGMFLLDYHLPQLTGGELCWMIQKLEGLSQIPVILMSADEASIPPQCKRCASRFIKKPFEIDDLLQTIERAVRESPALKI